MITKVLQTASRAKIKLAFGPVLLSAGIALAILLPGHSDRRDVWNIAFLVCLSVALGQSWNMLGGFAGQTSLGHAAFFGIGALVTRVLWFNGTPFVAALGAGGLAAAIFGLVIAAPTFRLRGAYFAIGTLGVAEALRIVVSQNLPLISTMPAAMIATYDQPQRAYVALGLASIATAAAHLLLRSRWSLGLLAVREDEAAAQAAGVNVFLHKMLALAISSLFAGLCGGVFAFQQISYYPSAPFSAVWSFDAVLITFIGGLGTLAGPVIGAVFFVFMREQLAINLVEIHQVIFGLVFILIVLAFPGGLVQGWRWLRKAVAGAATRDVAV